MRYVVCAVLALAFCAAGCVKVDLGQASKDWSQVGKDFADAYKSQGQDPAGSPAQPPPPPSPPQ